MHSLYGLTLIGVAALSSVVGSPAKRLPVSLRWFEPNSHQRLFTVDDVVRFDWDRQRFELSRDAAISLLMLPPALDREFVVADDYGEIYRGQMVSSESSKTYAGPVIQVDAPALGLQPPLYALSSGYPGKTDRKPDPRFDPRLRLALEAAGVLGELDANQLPPSIETQFIPWCERAHGLKIAATLFPETFRVGRDARVLLRLSGDPKFHLDADRLELAISLLRDEDDSQISHLADVPFALLDEPLSVFAWHGRPWLRESQEPDASDPAATGTAKLKIELRAVLETADGPRVTAAWQLPPQEVDILPPEEGAQSWPRSGKAAAPVCLPTEARAVMLRFTRALADSQWEEALSLCSEEVRAAARGYPSAEEFFKTVVPLEQLAGLKQFSIRRFLDDSSFGMFVTVMQPDAELKVAINWSWAVERREDTWRVHFETALAAEWTTSKRDEVVASRKAHAAAIAALDPTMEKVHTRLVPLNPEFVLGEPMRFRLELINGSDVELAYDAQQVAVNASLIVKNAAGVIVPYVGGPTQTGGFYKPLGPSQTAVLADDMNIAPQYYISQPGRYTVQFTGGALSSASPNCKIPTRQAPSSRPATSPPTQLKSPSVRPCQLKRMVPPNAKTPNENGCRRRASRYRLVCTKVPRAGCSQAGLFQFRNCRQKASLENNRFVGPIGRELGQRFGGGIVDSLFAADGEVNPATTGGAAPGETNVFPPGSHQGIVNIPAEGFQPEIDRLQVLSTPGMRAARLSIDNVRCHELLGSSRTIYGVHVIRLRGSKVRNCLGHNSPPQDTSSISPIVCRLKSSAENVESSRDSQPCRRGIQNLDLGRVSPLPCQHEAGLFT